jgi:hypothetical protein
MRTMKNLTRLTVLAITVAALGGCSSEMVNDSAPVELVVTNAQNLNRIDIDADSTGCDQNVGTINMQVIPKPGNSDEGNFDQVRVKSYRVTYRRLDGGSVVPASFVRPLDTLISVGGSSGAVDFQLAEPDIFSRAPFASLLPQNGGIDAETGRRFITMQIFVEVFGETLGGDDVYDSTSFPLEFCYDCGGCA